jgi:hypothetical protein
MGDFSFIEDAAGVVIWGGGAGGSAVLKAVPPGVNIEEVVEDGESGF